MDTSADIGVIGLGVMGANLALNLADSGQTVAVYNRTPSTTMDFMAGEAVDKDIMSSVSLEELVDCLERPRRILLMIPAGNPVDTVIEDLVPLLEPGDIIMDGGNSLYTDTDRRTSSLTDLGLRYLGIGFSGGEEGARHGPSIMPGGSPDAWAVVEDMLKGIAALAPDGEPCCEWVGPGGAGHFVKMVHNGIEYGDMQVIAEAYDLMRRGMSMGPTEIGEVFARWDEGRLDSYLIEITAAILAESEGGEPMIDKILDAAGQKGTGKWTVIASMELAEPTTLVSEAVYARIVSSDPDLRKTLAGVFSEPTGEISDVHVDDIESALYASKIISYAQGFRLMSRASKEFGWDLDMASIASLWRAGCIIRAEFLGDIMRAFEAEPDMEDLTTADFFKSALKEAIDPWRNVVAASVAAGLPVPAYASALTYFDGMRSERLPASLIQAQRDYFGAHTFERVDEPRGEFFHHDWDLD
ncbi:MAG: phosphogluconate dehydrogenase (NADP(+)-dependent, decarboxylating) [Actinobacteria bacterium]|nr:MAG: phosphogluconate dehydrogenase (NADP(+)-dependent, decarboxylating) [Actinomycetota bacterium]